MEIIQVSDLVDPNSSDGKTYKEVNAEKTHGYAIGQLVELDSGVRLFVAKLTRDCDMTPLYSLCADREGDVNNMFGWSHGYDEDSLSEVLS